MKKLVALICALVLCLGAVSTAFAEDAPVYPLVPVDPTKQYAEKIIVGTDAQITTLDPTQKNNVIQNVLFNCTHDTLITFDNATGEYTPGLATSWEWINDTTLRLKLREGVVFHDGTSFDAYDVQASLNRHVAGLVTNTYDHCEIIDPYTIDTVVKTPNVDWVFVLSHNSSAICSAEAIAADPDHAWTGTGPYKVISDSAGDIIEMERNDNYWGELGATKYLTFRYYGEASARLIALENGEINVCMTVSDSDLQFAKEDKNIVVEDFTSSNLFYFCFNCESEVGKDMDLRKAVAYAINRDQMVAALGGSPAYTMWGWNSLGYTTDFAEDYTYNPELAKEYAAKAAHKEFTLITYTPTNIMGAILQQNLRDVGITMNIQQMDSAGISSATKWGANHEAVIYSMATNASGSDMFRLIAYGTAGNRANVHDENHLMYTLQTASNAEFDEQKRIELLHELQAVMHDQCIYYGLMYGTATIAYTKGIENPGLLVNKNWDFSRIQLPLN